MIFGRPAYQPHPGKRHGPLIHTLEADGTITKVYGCGCPYSEDAARRGRLNRLRGNDFEREVARKLGVKRVGQYGGPEDVGAAADWIMVQTKVGNATYPTRIDALLRRIPFRADGLRAVVHGDSPGGGVKRRSLITLDLDEFCQWYGGSARED